MKLIEKRIQKLQYAQGMAISNKYMVFPTGKRALIYNRKFELVQEIEGLSYCYKAYISPDEERVLLISTSNRFYILSLLTFEITKYTIRGKYNGNLEGRGCWSVDGSCILLCVHGRQHAGSALRIYDIKNMSNYFEVLNDKYFLTSIIPTPEMNKYLLTGFNYSNYSNYMIWYSEGSLEEYQLKNFDDITVSTKHDKEKQEITIYGLDYTIICDYNGNIINKIVAEGEITASFSDVFKGLDFEPESLKKITELSRLLGLEDVSISDSILSSCYICDGRYLCVGTHQYLCCIEMSSDEVVFRKKVPYGVHDIIEISQGVIMIETWSGIKVFELLNEK